MKKFKEYFTEAIVPPLDLGVFHNVISELKYIAQDYKEGKLDIKQFGKDEDGHYGIGYDFVINFSGTPFEYLGRKRLNISIGTFPSEAFDNGVIRLNLDDAFNDPSLSTLNHELVHFLQVSVEKAGKKWGLSTPKLTRKHGKYGMGSHITQHQLRPIEYYPNLVEMFTTLRYYMNELNISKEKLIDYFTSDRKTFDVINELLFIKQRLYKAMKSEPELGKRYIKRLYKEL